MDEDLRKQLDWMNENIQAVVKNQAEIYMELKEIERRLPEQEAKG
jgi:hypothetical protein